MMQVTESGRGRGCGQQSGVKTMIRMRGLILMLLIYFKFTEANRLIFSASSDEELFKMTIARRNDDVFVAGENFIYKLSANLSQLMNVSVSSDDTVRVRGLSVTNGGQYIVACLTTGRCIGYDVINLNTTDSNVPLNEPMGSVFPGDDPVVIFPGNVGIIHTGTAVEDGISPPVYRMSLGQYSVSLGSIMADTTRDYELITSRDFTTRTFKAGFTIDSDNFTYYIVEDDGQRIRVLRVCNSESVRFQGLYEVLLECGGTAVFAGASILLNSTNTLVLTVRSPDTTTGTQSGRMCTYNISDINAAMENGQIACAAESDRSTVWNVNLFNPTIYGGICASATPCSLEIMVGGITFSLEAIRGDTVTSSGPGSALVIEEISDQFREFSSSVIVQVEGELLMFIGTSNGLLIKYNFLNQNFSNPVRYDTTSITNISITSLQWSLGSDYVYGLTSRQVIAIPIEDCEPFSDCTSCTGLGNPLCGWCSIEDKCSRRSECRKNSETRRWIQNQTMCIVNFAVLPDVLSVQMINQKLTITADQLPPPLDGESYYCVFGDIGSSLLEGNLIPGVNFTGLTCNYSFIVEQFSNGRDDTAVVDFSLRSDLTNVSFITINGGFTFFNCSTHASCRSCLSSNNLCGWCLYDKKCTSSSDQCRVSTDWINTGNSSITLCPLILRRNNTNSTNGMSEYQQPAGVLRNLSLNAINLPAPIENYTYECVILYNGLESMIIAEYRGPNNDLVCVPEVNDFEEIEYVNNASVSVLWTGPNVMYNLEMEIDPLTVILYNCTALAGGCSSCLSATNLLSLDCGWCHDSGSCTLAEYCSASSTFTANSTSSDTCPSPQITTVNPNSGPYQGGTTITITGTDLGVVVQDIISVTIGGVPCMVDSNNYQPGIRLSCTTSSSSARFNVNITIVINRGGTIQSTYLSNGFRYSEVIITDFNPKKIPQSGDVTIDVFGSNFDISNPALARIRVADTSCSIIQQTLNSTFIQCIAGQRPQQGIGPVVFIIDNSVTESDNDFTYTNDPQLFALRNNKVIKSGGVKLVYIGSDLDVVQIVLIIDIVDSTVSNSTIVEMSYSIMCVAESDDRELSCIFPAITPNLLDGIITGTLQLRYSLVAASVPGLDNLHLMSPFVINFVDDPVVTPFNETVVYQRGSSAAIMITGMNLIVVDPSEIQVTVGNGSCDIITLTAIAISCIPPQSGNGIVNVMVHVGENLNYTVGKLQYYFNNNTRDTVPTRSTTFNITTIIIIVAIAVIVFIIVIIIAIIIICVVRKKSNKSTATITGINNISMYASPAYGTHHVFSEPGMDHLYDRIDGSYRKKATVLQNSLQANDDDTTADDYIKMNSFTKVTDRKPVVQNVTGKTDCAVDDYPPSDEQIQGKNRKNLLPTGNMYNNL